MSLSLIASSNGRKQRRAYWNQQVKIPCSLPKNLLISMGSFDSLEKYAGSRYKKNYMEGIMLQTVKRHYKGKIELEEDIRIKKKVPVLVTSSEKGMRKAFSAL